MRKKKILLAIGDVGYGHRAAANALAYIFDQKYKDEVEHTIVDFFTRSRVSPFNTSDISYTVTSGSRILLQLSEIIWRITNTRFGFRVMKWFTVSKLYDAFLAIIEEESPDVIVSAHYYVSMVLEEIKTRNPNAFKSATIVTDLITLSRGWVDSTADFTFCPTKNGVSTLVKYGADIEKIIYPLFPINPKFKLMRRREEILTELGFELDKPTILITGGGVGNKSLAKAIKSLVKREDLQLIIVCGKNQDLEEYLTYQYKNRAGMKVFGYVDNMYDYMGASDIIFAKPGANTVMEILVVANKAILSKHIGEQERGNVSYALKSPKVRYIKRSMGKLKRTIDALLKAKINEFNFAEVPRRHLDETEMMADKIIELAGLEAKPI